MSTQLQLPLLLLGRTSLSKGAGRKGGGIGGGGGGKLGVGEECVLHNTVK